MKVYECEIKYKCDYCKKIFIGKDVKLIPATSNIEINSMLAGLPTFVTSDGTVVGKRSADIGDQTMHCPYCAGLHLFGFNRVTE